MNNKRIRTLTIALAVMLGLLAARPANSNACYMSPEDMVEMTVRQHFWAQHKEAAENKTEIRVIVRNVVITKKGATALASVKVGDAMTYHRVTLKGQKYRIKIATVGNATRDQVALMKALAKVDEFRVKLWELQRSQALAKR